MSKSQAVEHLSAQISYNQQIAARVERADPQLQARLNELQQWQWARLDATYADLRQDPRYRPACDFFLDELYGGRDVHERDRQLTRVVPVMRRFLPAHLLKAVGDAVQLQAVSLEFDLDLAEILLDDSELSQPAYARAYRIHGMWQARDYQLLLIAKLGELLDETVQRPMVHRLIRVMHGPAVMAGFGALQEFLRRGLDAFKQLNGADYFLTTIEQRERKALDSIREGSDWPFAEWIGKGPDWSAGTEE
jgi:hypothetical protein